MFTVDLLFLPQDFDMCRGVDWELTKRICFQGLYESILSRAEAQVLGIVT